MEMNTLLETAAVVCLVWSCFVFVVQVIGIRAIFRYFSRPPPPSVSSKVGRDAPRVTIIRPVKGLEPHLYGCIASTFRQDYPRDRQSVRLCVDDRSDPAYPILVKLVEDFPEFDAQVLVESDDPVLHGPKGSASALGPNPKIRNISRAYREANGDLLWMIDCNVWVASGVLGRMVDKLEGYSTDGAASSPYKFVHHLPIVVDITGKTAGSSYDLLPEEAGAADALTNKPFGVSSGGGGRLDEMFMATSHAKFYGAINAVGVAPCIVGKSNMFRKSHLDQITDVTVNPALPQYKANWRGTDFFSDNICEDHLIGDLLWRTQMPGFKNHGCMWGDLVVQPLAGMSLSAYTARRVRWLRARKFTVLAATLVEPGVEPLLCCAYFSFAVTTLPWFHETFGITQTWLTGALAWLSAVALWMLADWIVFRRLHSGYSIETDETAPSFIKGKSGYGADTSRSFFDWLPAWVGRETLALPIWTRAVLLGRTVRWRGKAFMVDFDATVHEIKSGISESDRIRTPELDRSRQSSKDRLD